MSTYLLSSVVRGIFKYLKVDLQNTHGKQDYDFKKHI